MSQPIEYTGEDTSARTSASPRYSAAWRRLETQPHWFESWSDRARPEHRMPQEIDETLPITWFHGRYGFLSNFYSGHWVDYDGRSWPTAEHAYQGMKTFLAVEQFRIRKADTAARARELGRSCTLRPHWEMVKVAVMEEVLWAKFQVPELRAALLATGDRELVEGTLGSGRFWEREVATGRGENFLGILLMGIREAIR